MPVPSSGQLRLRADINQEINGNDTDDNVSLGTLSNDAGFSEPDSMSEFYSYSSVVPPTIGSVNFFTANPDGRIGIYGILNSTGGGAVTAYGIKVGTSSDINNATTYQHGTSWGIYSYKYPDATGFSNNTTYHGWIYATNSAGTTNVYAGSVTIPAPYVPITASNISISGDQNIYTYANGCKNNIINSLVQTHFNTTAQTQTYNYYQKYTTTYLNTCPNQCRKDYSGSLQGYQSATYTRSFEWNYNGAGGAYQSCDLCVVKSSIPTTTENILVFTKSGYTTRQYTMNLLNFIN